MKHENDTCSSVFVLALQNSTGTGAMLFISNTGPKRCNVTLSFGEWADPSAPLSILIHRIDQDHLNPLGVWGSMGFPAFPSLPQIKQMKIASELRPAVMETGPGGKAVFDLHPHAMTTISF